MSSYDKEQVIKEANTRFLAASDWESYWRDAAQSDLRFEAGDSMNNFQWPTEMIDLRDGKPTLTLNKVQLHVKHVVNNGLKNLPGMSFKPSGGGSTFQSAEVFQDLSRQIEVESCAVNAYATAFASAVKVGIGYWTMMTEYENPDDFDQSIRIKPINNALSVYLDHTIKEKNGSDARWGFVYDDIATDLFKETYPKYADLASNNTPLGTDPNKTEMKKDIVRTVEYYRIVEDDDRLHRLEDFDDNGYPIALHVKESDMPKENKKEILTKSVQQRPIKTKRLEWFLIVGQDIVEYRELPGTYIPIIRVVGEERVIDGIMDRTGLVRNLIDAQRMYNVMNSGAAEHIALQTKIPWIAAMAAIGKYIPDWDNQNIDNPQYLLWDHLDDAGNPTVPAPSKLTPPVYPQAFQQGIQQAANDMMLVSGQYESSMGQESNERSGKAVDARTDNAENATYHFHHALNMAITYAGMIMLQWIPKVYDTPGRVLKCLGQDGKTKSIMLNPSLTDNNGQPMAHQMMDNVDPESMTPDQVALIFNPNAGKYSVVADAGDNYATQNDQLFNALSQLSQQQPDLMKLYGDLMFQAMNIPLADKVSERFRRIADPHMLGIGPSAAEQQMQATIQQLQQFLAQQHDEIQKLKSKALDTEAQKEIDLMNAMTKRFEAMIKADPELAKTLARHLGHDLAGGDITPAIMATLATNAAMLNVGNPNANAQPAPPQPPPSPQPMAQPPQPNQGQQ